MPPMRFSASSADRLMTCPGSANLEEAIPEFVPPEKNENGRKGQGKIIHDLMAQIGELPIRDVEKMLEAIQFLATLDGCSLLTVEGIGRGNKAVSLTLKPAQREALRQRRARKGSALTPRVKPERMV